MSKHKLDHELTAVCEALLTSECTRMAAVVKRARDRLRRLSSEEEFPVKMEHANDHVEYWCNQVEARCNYAKTGK